MVVDIEDLSTMSSSVKYSKLSKGESETTIFDYSSPFKYQSTDADNYKSIFDYKTPMKSHEYDIQRERGRFH